MTIDESKIIEPILWPIQGTPAGKVVCIKESLFHNHYDSLLKTNIKLIKLLS